MILMNVLTVRPTLLTGDSNCAQEQRKSRLRLWSVDEAESFVTGSAPHAGAELP